MASVMRLHLQYRLWIAEMNADINDLRIFDDYIVWIEEKSKSAITINRINNYKKQFSSLRKELDELRHEMHIVKMKLAAISKKENSPPENIEQLINHKVFKERYKVFKKKFSQIRKEFKKIEAE
jgi:predicted  nucleic acid-binding Zn-ribbon protein